jgi:hypothetical protein
MERISKNRTLLGPALTEIWEGSGQDERASGKIFWSMMIDEAKQWIPLPT